MTPPDSASRPPLRVGVVGFGWMGRVHAAAYSRLHHHYPRLGRRVELVAVADSDPASLPDAVARFGTVRTHRDWRELVEAPDVDAVSVTTPNWLHREVGVAVARAGKHLWIEKPVGLDADDARAVAAAIDEAGVRAVVGFNYRHVPAVAHARALLQRGGIGTPTSMQVRFATDYAASPNGVLTWRFRRQRGGNGVLGDLASHAVDLVRHLLGPAGEITDVVAVTGLAVPRRPLPADDAASHYAVAGPSPSVAMGDVENPDWVDALLRTAGGATVTLEASRVAVGEQNAYRFEIAGTRGRLAWDFRQMGELVHSGPEHVGAPEVHLTTGPAHGEYGAFEPGPGIALGYDDLKVIEAAAFLRLITGHRGGPVAATPADAVRSAEVLDAMERSVHEGRWVPTSGASRPPVPAPEPSVG
ncbi:MAG TPA: Gfo/Idh/MocA family oxidoreductase [Kineosporiaceae bacterium]|nr:Gfo/Idh/MocA family oxidoreductase [Kineosporiaceae bacterium]